MFIIKHFCLLVSLILIGITTKTKAQITITADDFPTTIGTEYANYEGWGQINFDVHVTGANIIWDYEDADTLMGELLTEIIVDPEGSIFPNTNIFMIKTYEFMGSTHYVETHSEISDSDLYFLGYRLYDEIFQDTTTVEAHPGIGFFKFPMTYQSQWEGTYLQKIVTNGVTMDTITVRYQCDVNGWGTIITPYGIFDCLKLFTVWSHWNDTISNWYDYDTTYTWLSNDIPMVFQIDDYEYNVNGSGNATAYYRVYESGNLDINEQSREPEISSTPNPFFEKINITYYLSNPSHVDISIYDVNGKRVTNLVNKTQDRGKQTLIWQPDKIPPGIYLCILKTGKKSNTLKLIRK